MSIGPTFLRERALPAPVAGIDEAGRGPWAGPVVAAAVIIDPACMIEGIDDSKKLSPVRRERLAGRIMATWQVGIGIASVAEIDQLNILRANDLAMQRAVAALPARPAACLVDGNRAPPDLPGLCQAIVGGDRLSLSIAAASIIAKVTRDAIMAELAQAHPGYGWAQNKGYGTAEHARALAEHGVTAHHRRSFAPVRAALVIAPAQ